MNPKTLVTERLPKTSEYPSPVIPSERRWIFWAALIGMLITSLPYLLGFQMQGDDWRFTGFVFGVSDGNSYIAKMLAGAEGDWLFRTPYTPFEQRGILAFFPFIVLGKLVSPPAQHEQLVAVYHLYRFVGGVLAILATYEFLAIFINRVSLRRLGTLVACFGGGLGWLLVLLRQGNWLGSLPLDFYSPETFGFLSLYGLPHLAFARALLLWGLLAYLKHETQPLISKIALPSGLLSGLLWVVMGFFQPLTIAIAWIVMGVHLTGYGLFLFARGARNRTDFQPWLIFLQRAIIAGLVSAPFVVYSFLALRSDLFLSGWMSQNKLPSPVPLHYIAAYALIFPFVILGARYLVRTLHIQSWLLIGWALLLPVLVYMPFNLQRRFPEGIWVALVALALAAFDHAKPPTRWWYLPIAMTFPSTLFLLAGGITTTWNPHLPTFRPASEVNAFLFLGEYAKFGDLVLTSFDTGNVLPAWAPVRVVIGHGPESVGLAELQPRVEAFFQSETSDLDRLAFVDEFGVRYIFWGPLEQALGDWNPRETNFLEEVYHEDGYFIFEIAR